MKTSSLAVLFLPLVALSLVAASPAQTAVALVDAPTPAADSSSSLFSDPAGGPMAFTPVQQIAAPAREKKPGLHLYDWSMIGAAAVLRGLDYASTESAMARPQDFHEDILPSALVHNKPAFAAFQAGTVALNYEAYKYLVHHNLRSLARASQYMYVGVMTFQVAHNYQTLGSYPPN
jgi:hypothetical protein